MLNRFTGSLENFINTLVLGEVPPQIHLYKKEIETSDSNIVTSVNNQGDLLGVIRDFYPDSNNFDITEGQISMTNISGQYLTPIFFND